MAEPWEHGYRPGPNTDGLDPFRQIPVDELLGLLTEKQRFVFELRLGIRDGKRRLATVV
jgi:hypothetical protein